MILDAPGAVVTTATRPDNLTVTMRRLPRHLPPAGLVGTRGTDVVGVM